MGGGLGSGWLVLFLLFEGWGSWATSREPGPPRGPPHRHGDRPHAAYEVAATDDGAEANVDRACTRH